MVNRLFKARQVANLILVFTAIWVFLIQKRYYPFSDYIMFSTVKHDLRAVTLILVDKEGSDFLIPDESLLPLSKLHLYQMLAVALDNQSDFQWLKSFCAGLKISKKYDRIKVVSGNYDYLSDHFIIQKVYYETPVQ